jgi:aspartate dehydrogenase
VFLCDWHFAIQAPYLLMEAIMENPLSIAILGHGTIAGYVMDQIRDDTNIKLSAVLARVPSLDKAKVFTRGICPVITSSHQLPADVELVIDCAGHEGLLAHGTDILSAGIDMITISTGALADVEFFNQLESAAKKGNSRLKLLSGAIGGIDALMAANVGELSSVNYIGRKPPTGWKGSPAEHQCDLMALTSPFTHFKGTARNAATQYPKNANVAATIALAGISMDDTKVELIADPNITKNTHEVHAVGSFGNFQLKIEGKPLPGNPKSSALAAMSIVQELRRRISIVGF